MTSPDLKVAALFAGIGGIELGLKRALGSAVETSMFCEWWTPAQDVLRARFPDVDVHPDVRELAKLPADANFVTAGFPCTDLSQAGRMVGIDGVNSGLVKHLFDALRMAKAAKHLPTLFIENVPNMLALDKGKAMAYLVSELESLGYRWAYRVVDSRFSGVPQRRRRVLLLASTQFDPRSVLFADDAGPLPTDDLKDSSFGFYWTEGRSGLGWAQDAVPTIKGGSTIGIPSPPAIWLPGAEIDRRFVKPLIEDAEAMQGFDRGWTEVDFTETSRRAGSRWKMVGNAVTVGVAEWVGRRLLNPGEVVAEFEPWELGQGAWPSVAWGESGRVWTASMSEFPEHLPYQHLGELVDTNSADPLSFRAASGFWNRLQKGNLGRYPGFRDDVENYVEAVAGR